MRKRFVLGDANASVTGSLGFIAADELSRRN